MKWAELGTFQHALVTVVLSGHLQESFAQERTDISFMDPKFHNLIVSLVSDDVDWLSVFTEFSPWARQ